MAKDSFLMYTEWGNTIKRLSYEQAGVLLNAIFSYEKCEPLPEMDDKTDMCFAFIQGQLDRDSAKYTEVCEKRKESGRLGGVANATKRKQMVANGSTRKQNVANQADNDNEYDNDNDYEYDDDLKKEKRKKIIIDDAERKRLEERDRILEEDDYAARHEGAGEVYFEPRVKLGWVKPKEESETRNGIPKPPSMSDAEYQRIMDRLTAFKERKAQGG